MKAVTKIIVNYMYESCQRHSYFVDMVNEEGYLITHEAFLTGSLYNDFQGLSREEARERALSTAVKLADFFGVSPEPYIEDGREHKAKWDRRPYTHQRAIDAIS